MVVNWQTNAIGSFLMQIRMQLGYTIGRSSQLLWGGYSEYLSFFCLARWSVQPLPSPPPSADVYGGSLFLLFHSLFIVLNRNGWWPCDSESSRFMTPIFKEGKRIKSNQDNPLFVVLYTIINFLGWDFACDVLFIDAPIFGWKKNPPSWRCIRLGTPNSPMSWDEISCG